MLRADRNGLVIQIVERNDKNEEGTLVVSNCACLCDLIKLQTKPCILRGNREVRRERGVSDHSIIRWRKESALRLARHGSSISRECIFRSQRGFERDLILTELIRDGVINLLIGQCEQIAFASTSDYIENNLRVRVTRLKFVTHQGTGLETIR